MKNINLKFINCILKKLLISWLYQITYLQNYIINIKSKQLLDSLYLITQLYFNYWLSVKNKMLNLIKLFYCLVFNVNELKQNKIQFIN